MTQTRQVPIKQFLSLHNKSRNSCDGKITIPLSLVELSITSTSYGGKGIARLDGKVFFVEDAVEGDLVLAEITEETGRYNTAVTREILTPSPWRRLSQCPFSDRCGGCQWQEVPYEQQLVWKEQFITGALQRIGKLGSEIKCRMLGSPESQGYRNRILLRARLHSDGSIHVGYFMRGSRDFVEISHCLIAGIRINGFIEQLKQQKFTMPSGFSEVKFRFEVQDLPAAASDAKHLLVSVYDPDDLKFPVSEIIKVFTALPSVAWTGSVRNLAEAPFVPFETDLGITFHTAAGLFQQVNISHNHTLRRLVHETVNRLGSRSILDIFCGSGNLSLPVADGKRTVRGVEYSKRAIDCAKYNCERNQISNAEYFSGDTEKFLWRAAKSGERYDLVIADPPREGMYKALIPLMKLAPKHIIYISCDPTTLARDLGSLCRKDYKIIDLAGLDFFPNSFHVESFVVLERLT